MGGRVTDRPNWSPDEVDPTRPSVARVYDFYLGGSHNFEADREFGRRALGAFPDALAAIRDNRHFIRRAVRYACASGVHQFLDLGSGIPTVGNVHEVALDVEPGARVVYVDHDPVAVTHSLALLETVPGATAIQADLREPARVRDAVRETGLLDPDRPVAVLLAWVLHFIQDDEHPADLVAEYMRPLAPGSLVALSHTRSDGRPETVGMAKVYDQSASPGRPRLRSRDEIAALFGDLALVDPGLVVVPRWRPELTGDRVPPDVDDHPGLCGVGRRD